MNRWESIANQFGKIEGVGLVAMLRNDQVAKWDVIGDSKSNGKKFLAIVDEASSQLGGDDRFGWFNHPWKIYQNLFEVSGQPFPGIEHPGGEEVWFCHKTIEDAAGLSARAARDLAEIDEEESSISETNQTPISGKSTATAVEALLGGESKEVLDIANSSESVDTKMRKICGVDVRFLGYNSIQWAELLGVTDAAIRQTDFWTKDRPKAIEANQTLSGN